jgi:DNA-binding response OmpR family regulator
LFAQFHRQAHGGSPELAEVVIIVADSMAGLTPRETVALVKNLRAEGCSASIVILSDDLRQHECDYLHSGADDVLPVSLPVARLHSRVQALARRARRCWTEAQEAISVDHERRVIRIGTIESKPSALDFRLFVYLLKRRRSWVTPLDLLHDVFEVHHGTDTSVVRVHIHSLRRSLGAERHRILSERGLGWMLNA